MTRSEALVGKLSIEDAEWRAGLAKAASQFRGFSQQVSMGLSGAFRSGLAGVSSFVSGAGGMLRGLMSNIAGLAGALGLGGLLSAGGIVAGIKSITDLGGELSDVNARTGIAIDQLVLLREQFRQGGIDAGSVTTYVRRMNEALMDADKKKLFEALGLSPQGLMAGAPYETINKIIDAVRRLNSTALQQKTLANIFGPRQGIQLMTLVADPNMEASARKMVGSLTKVMDENAGEFDRISDNLFGGIPVKLQQAFAGFTVSLLGALTPITDWFEGLDFSRTGALLGAQLVWAYNIFAGLWNDGKLWEFAGMMLEKAFIKATSFLASAVDQTFKAIFSSSNLQFLKTLFLGIGTWLGGMVQEQIAYIREALPGGSWYAMSGQRDYDISQGKDKQASGIFAMENGAAAAIGSVPDSVMRAMTGTLNSEVLPMFAGEMRRVDGRINELISAAAYSIGVEGTSPITKAGGVSALRPSSRPADEPLFPPIGKASPVDEAALAKAFKAQFESSPMPVRVMASDIGVD